MLGILSRILFILLAFFCSCDPAVELIDDTISDGSYYDKPKHTSEGSCQSNEDCNPPYSICIDQRCEDQRILMDGLCTKDTDCSDHMICNEDGQCCRIINDTCEEDEECCSGYCDNFLCSEAEAPADHPLP